MGVDVEVIAPAGMPDADEPISAFARCRGNILMATEDVGFPRLDKCEQGTEAARALVALIEDLDRGDEGVFTYDYWEAADQQWSKGREMRQTMETARLITRRCPSLGKTPEQYAAGMKRDEMRKTAFRFLSYFKMGYTIEWDY